MNDNKIKVLIVDDSLVFRELLAKGISGDPRIEVVAKAMDPYEARDMIIRHKPDVMTCDVRMPKMDGVEFIRRLLPQYHLPVIVVSSASEAVLDALDAGAVEFVTKPDFHSPHDAERFISDLIFKIKVAAKANLKVNRRAPAREISENQAVGTDKIIAIGASTGGTEAIFSILSSFPGNSPGVVIVQHIPPMFSKMFSERLDRQTNLHVKEARTGDFIENGKVLLAPGDRHMRIKKLGSKYKVECFEAEKVNGHCPSVDVLFNSVAKEAGRQAVGVILTGMGNDGAKGLLAMRRAGARTIGQDEKTSIVYGMPKTAYNIGAVEKQVSLESIPNAVFSLLR
ncbi:MAG: protein-glutamate methylesterase/protein-glutamine glutaminase [Bacillota bacterium]